jgi:hypothetical protein
MRVNQPEKDWSRPVWVSRAEAEAVVGRVCAEQAQEHIDARKRALHHVARNGVRDLIAHAQQPGALAIDGDAFPRLRDERPDLLRDINEEREKRRLRLLASSAVTAWTQPIPFSW